jgi:signal transduction histidine kinase
MFLAMSDKTAARVAWGLALACFVMAGIILFYYLVSRATPDLGGVGGTATVGIENAIPAVTFGALGGLVAARQPRNPIGWLMLAIATTVGLSAAAFFVAKHALISGASATGWVPWEAWVGLRLSNVGSAALALIFLLFPTGTPLNDRWRWVVWIGALASIVYSIGALLDDAPLLVLSRSSRLRNPVGVPALKGFSDYAFLPILLLLLIGAVGLLVRLRRSQGDERQQLKWFVYAVAVSMGVFVLGILSISISQRLADAMGNLAFNLGFAFAVPIAMAVAILRYGLYEIDLVINKTVLYGSLAAFLTAIYLAVVVGIGSLLGSTHNTFLTLLAAALIALAFDPARQRAKRFADRLVYGERATPYEVLSRFSEQMAGTYALDDILPRMARVLSEGTGGNSGIWLRVGQTLRAVATWPGELDPRSPTMPLSGEELPSIPGVSRAAPVLHQGELLGAITVTKPANDPLRPGEEKLIADVSSQAGLVLRNVRLIQELRASRQRLVSAQDEERRKIERNIHDGAQQQLVALSVKLRLLEQLAERDPAKAKELASELQAESTDALEDLRNLARGIYPPLLADRGLVPALESQVRKSSVPVTIEAEGLARYPQDIEAAVYFCCLEALQNVAKYAEADAATIRLSDGSGVLTFEVRDDGRGFDAGSTGYGTGLQGMQDRLDALGGSLLIRSAPDEGTSIVGQLTASPSRPRS